MAAGTHVDQKRPATRLPWVLGPLVGSLLVSTPAWAGCPATASELTVEVNASESAFSSMNPEEFTQARSAALDLVGCLEEQLPPADAAGFHRMQAYAAFMDQDDESAVQSFQAALVLQPGYRLPSSIAPEGSPLRDLYTRAAQAPASPQAELSAPADLNLYVDGQLAEAHPTDRAFILQVLSESGEVHWSGYLAPDESLPDFAAWSQPPEPPAPAPSPVVEAAPPVAPDPGFPTGRAVVTGVAVTTAAVLGYFALDARSTYQSVKDQCSTQTGGCNTYTIDNMNDYKDRAIGLGIGAGAGALVGLGFGISLAF